MTLDPSRWLVSLAGFVYDWIITREWIKSLLLLAPVFLGLAAIGVVFWGSRRDPRALAVWYLELGNEEISGWENAFAPAAPTVGTENAESTDGGSAGVVSDEPAALAGDRSSGDGSDDGEASGSDKPGTIPRFADVLFRRVQSLQPSDRSQFIIGAILAQRGALAQAERLLSEIAPDDGLAGYVPAHAIMAELYVPKYNADPNKYALPLLRHLAEGARWSRMPIKLLTIGAELCVRLNRKAEALNFMVIAAEREPVYYVELARFAAGTGNERVSKEALEKFESYLLSQLETNASDERSRSMLAEYYMRSRRMKDAEKLLFPGQVEFEVTDLLRRRQSDYYCEMFMKSLASADGKTNVNLLYLDRARELDSNNPKVSTCISLLPRLGVTNVDFKLIEALQGFLASGTASTTAHALLGESYLTKNNFSKAETHFQQVVLRDPLNAKCLNNLAYIMADMYPDRLPEALEFAERSVKAAAASKAPNAEYLDTLGLILGKMDRKQEAIAAFQTAIQLDSKKIAFHEQIAALYESVGSGEMADVHMDFAKQLRAAEQAAAKPSEPAISSESESSQEQPAEEESSEGKQGLSERNGSEGEAGERKGSEGDAGEGVEGEGSAGGSVLPAQAGT